MQVFLKSEAKFHLRGKYTIRTKVASLNMGLCRKKSGYSFQAMYVWNFQFGLGGQKLRIQPWNFHKKFDGNNIKGSDKSNVLHINES